MGSFLDGVVETAFFEGSIDKIHIEFDDKVQDIHPEDIGGVEHRAKGSNTEDRDRRVSVRDEGSIPNTAYRLALMYVRHTWQRSQE